MEQNVVCMNVKGGNEHINDDYSLIIICMYTSTILLYIFALRKHKSEYLMRHFRTL